MQTDLIAGFKQPVQDAQNVFRTTLQALSEPGLWQELALQDALDGLNPATWSILQALLDGDTCLYIAPELKTEKMLQNVLFHCACRVVDDAAEADFLVVNVADAQKMDWRQFKRGSERSPEQSATMLVQLDENEPVMQTVWQGPGILNQRLIHLPIDKAFYLQRASALSFPLGVDVVFTQNNSLLGLPRTTQVQFEGVATCM